MGDKLPGKNLDDEVEVFETIEVEDGDPTYGDRYGRLRCGVCYDVLPRGSKPGNCEEHS